MGGWKNSPPPPVFISMVNLFTSLPSEFLGAKRIRSLRSLLLQLTTLIKSIKPFNEILVLRQRR